MDRGVRGMNPVTMTIINPWKEHWPSQGSNQPPPVLKYCILTTELWGSANGFLEKGFGKMKGKGENAGNQHFLLFPLCFLSV